MDPHPCEGQSGATSNDMSDPAQSGAPGTGPCGRGTLPTLHMVMALRMHVEPGFGRAVRTQHREDHGGRNRRRAAGLSLP